jgi:hypothetical protein
VSCTDVRTGTPFEFRAQHVLGTGALDSTWVPDSSRMCVGSLAGGRQHLVRDGAGGTFFASVDERHGDPDIVVQRLAADGAVVTGWPATGRAVCDAARSQYHLDAIADGGGGVDLAWEDCRQGGAGVIAVQHLGAGGDPEAGWPDGGLLVCRDAEAQTSPRLALDGGGGVFVVWQDRRGAGHGLYGLRLLADGSRASG